MSMVFLVSTTKKSSYRPSIAYPAELEQEGEHFASGINTAGDARGICLAGQHFGITCTTARKPMLDELEFLNVGLQRLFVDTGAFGEVKFDKALKGFRTVKPITDAKWTTIFEIMMWAARTYGIRAYLVAPDKVGCQKTSLERLAKYAAQVSACAGLRANIIVPVQKGELPMSEFYRRASELLGLAQPPIAGVPMKKDATSLADLAELVGSLPWYGARIHLLGLGPESKRFRKVVALIKSIRPNAKITSDSVTLRRLVGRTNGRKGAPRAITAAQDKARALGLRSSTEVKAHGILTWGLSELDRAHARAEAAGWSDIELEGEDEEPAAAARAEAA